MADRFHISSQWQFTHISFKPTHMHTHTHQTPTHPRKNLSSYAKSAKPLKVTKTERKTQLHTSYRQIHSLKLINLIYTYTHIRIKGYCTLSSSVYTISMSWNEMIINVSWYRYQNYLHDNNILINIQIKWKSSNSIQ